MFLITDDDNYCHNYQGIGYALPEEIWKAINEIGIPIIGRQQEDA
jgi:hypothetical protein